MSLSNQSASVFIRRLNQVAAGVVPRIGFRAQQVEAPSALLIVVTLPGLEPELAEAAVRGGASALQVRMDPQAESGDAAVLQNLLKVMDGRPLGVLVTGTSGTNLERIESWRSAGVDFIVFGVDSDPAYLGVRGLGKIISIDHTVSSETIRSANELPVDAIQASLAKPDEIGSPLVIRDILRYRSLSMSVRKPVIVHADRKIVPGDVAALRDAKVEALSIDATQTGSDRDSIRTVTAEFAQAIKGLGAARGRGIAPVFPSIPGVGSGRVTSGVPEEEPEVEPEEPEE